MKNEINQQVQKLLLYLEKEGKTDSWSKLSKQFGPKGCSDDWSRTIARMNGFNTTTNQFSTQNKVAFTKQKKEIETHRKENNELISRIIELEKDLGLLAAVKEYNPNKFTITSPNNKQKTVATAIVQYSDWHVDEVVESKTVNGLNEYNKTIAKSRVAKCVENTVKLINTQRNAVDINNLVLHLGGDAIGGYIHPELQQTNSMSPLEGIFYAKDLMVSAIEYILQHGKLGNITIVCSRGNHPRLTPKMQFANDYSMNLETFLYWSLADYFKKEKTISFKIDQSELSYLTVYDRVLRFFHGHQIRFKGGIGGVTVPLHKAIHRWNSNIQAYYNFMCDKHTYSNPTPDSQINGSLKGYDAFAVSHGFSYQPPLQSFTLMDSKRGVTIKAPIFCE
jgi:hypothetical protein